MTAASRSVALREAVLCLDCETIRSSRERDSCAVCGSHSAWPVAPWLSGRRDRRRDQLRATIRSKLAARSGGRRLSAPDPPPRYDEVFAEGVAWLDSL